METVVAVVEARMLTSVESRLDCGANLTRAWKYSSPEEAATTLVQSETSAPVRVKVTIFNCCRNKSSSRAAVAVERESSTEEGEETAPKKLTQAHARQGNHVLCDCVFDYRQCLK